MNVYIFLKIKSVISLAFGIGLVFFASFILPLYGITLTSSGIVFSQWLGASFLGIGLICWIASGSEKSALFKGILLSLFISDSIGFITALLGQLAGLANMLGWSTVATWLILALGLGYFRFISKDV